LKSFSDALVYEQIEKICEEIEMESYGKALEFCVRNRTKLSAKKSRLEFRMHTIVFL
jgi:hypothetical protein